MIATMRVPYSLGMLHHLCQNLKNRGRMVEIGCYAGESTSIFAQNFEQVWAIDPWQVDMVLTGGEEPALPEFRMAAEVEQAFDERMKDFSNVTKMKAFDFEVIDSFPSNYLDFVYIDARHTGEEMSRQIMAWLPKLKPTGAIGGHDYNPSFPGLQQAIHTAVGEPDALFQDAGVSWVKWVNPFPLHFICTGTTFPYAYYLSVLSGLKVQDATHTILWTVQDVQSPWLERLKNRIQVRSLPVVEMPAMIGQEEHFIRAHTKDYWTYQVLNDYGGICLDLDTISLQDVRVLLGDKDLVVPADVPNPQDYEWPYNSAILVGRKGSPVLQQAAQEAKDRSNQTELVRWGMCGPYLISELVKAFPEKVVVPEYGVCGGVGGHEAALLYDESVPFSLSPLCRVLHLYAAQANRNGGVFDALTPSSIWGLSTVAQAVQKVLTPVEYDPLAQRPKFFVEIGSNTNNTLLYLAKSGWQGLIVEPIPEYLQALEKVSGVAYENVAIGTESGTAPFYYIPEETIRERKLPEWVRGIGSLRLHPLIEQHGWQDLVRTMEVPVCTVAELLTKYGITHIDYLKIDTEGWDCKILQDFDLAHVEQVQFEHKHCASIEVEREVARLEQHRFRYQVQGDNIMAIHSSPSRKFRFHLISLAHLPQNREMMACAFTQKARKLSAMLTSLGHEVFFYGSEGSDVEEYANCHLVQTHTLKDIAQDYGDGDNRFCIGYDYKNGEFRHDFNKERKPSTLKFYDTCIQEIARRKRPSDFLLLMQGSYHNPVRDKAGLYLNCEPGIGYRGSDRGNYRAFESSYIQNFTYGSEDPYASRNGSYYDRVIPNYFDPDDFVFGEAPEDFYLYIGRMIARKGIETAAKACNVLGKKLIIVGQGAHVDKNGYLVPNDNPDFHLPPGTWEYQGFADVEKRKYLMSHALATFVPTIYLEPFAGTHVESMISGCPPVTTNFGVFPETIPNVLNGIVGFRCNTLNDFVKAAHQAQYVDRRVVHEYGKKFLMNSVKWDFQEWFDDLYDVWESTQDVDRKGWHRIR